MSYLLGTIKEKRMGVEWRKILQKVADSSNISSDFETAFRILAIDYNDSNTVPST